MNYYKKTILVDLCSVVSTDDQFNLNIKALNSWKSRALSLGKLLFFHQRFFYFFFG